MQKNVQKSESPRKVNNDWAQTPDVNNTKGLRLKKIINCTQCVQEYRSIND